MEVDLVDHYSLGLKLDMDDPFVDCPSSAATSFASTKVAASLSHFQHPYTPMSSPATPNPFAAAGFSSPTHAQPHHGTPFSSTYGAPIPIELTPPPSAVSTYFPAGDLHHGHHHYHGQPTASMPVTPTRRPSHEIDLEHMLHLDFEAPGPLRDLFQGELNSRSGMDARLWGHAGVVPSSSAFNLHVGPSSSPPFDGSIWDLGQPAAGPQIGSPISFVGLSGPFDFNNASPMTCVAVKREMGANSAQRKTAALNGAARADRKTQRRKIRCDNQELVVDVTPENKYRCKVAGCDKVYKRGEHLKRHINTKHKEIKLVQCEHCSKTFNRRDNYRPHLLLHTQPRMRARVDYFANAEKTLEDERKKTKGRRRLRDPKAKTAMAKYAMTPKSGTEIQSVKLEDD